MEKIGRIIQKISEKEITKNLELADSFVVVGYSGLGGPEMNDLRQKLKINESRLLVIKNSVSKRVFSENGLNEFVEMLQGPCGLVFVKDDIIAASKVLHQFSKEHQTFKIAGGILNKRILNKSDILTLANIPSKTVLYSKTLAALQSPVYSFVSLLNNILKKLVIVLEQISKKETTK